MTTDGSLFRQVNALRKEQKLRQAWNLAQDGMIKNPEDMFLKTAFFWVCYRYIKQYQEYIAKRAKTSENYRPTESESKSLGYILQHALGLGIPFGGMEYSVLLFQCRKNLEHLPRLVAFILQNKDQLFQRKDKHPFVTEKGEIPSLMLTVARKVAQAWIESHQKHSWVFRDVEMFLQQVQRQVTDKNNRIWLDYDYAKCLLHAGMYEKARCLILPILRQKNKEAWAWGVLASTYSQENPRLAMQFTAQGCVCAKDPGYAVNLYRNAIAYFVQKKEFEKASMCTKKLVEIYQRHQWKINEKIRMHERQPWYDASVSTKELQDVMRNLAKGAFEYLMGPTETKKGIVESIHKSGKGFQIFCNQKESYSARMSVYQGKKKRPEVGDFVTVRVREGQDETEVVKVRPCASFHLVDYETIRGHLRTNPKGFAFVEDTFVAGYLYKGIPEGTYVKVRRIRTWNPKKKRLGWKAIQIIL